MDIEDAPQLRLPKISGFETRAGQNIYDDPEKQRRTPSASPEPSVSVPEDASPLERFRRPPKKSFSVTDLVSPSWCELQFYYSLAEPKRKKKTIAMKQGSAVHQALEDEVHVTVPIEIVKKEDKWGLRFWNVIQGLQTLRMTGRTRELEVWGTVGGEIVNGIIDELSYSCPDPRYEATQSEAAVQEHGTSIVDHMSPANYGSGPKVREQRVYITDVKTRGFPTLPTGSSIRPTILQLHLYYRLLEDLICGRFNVRQLAERYNFSLEETFSDSFIAQVGTLNQELSEYASPQEQEGTGTQVASTQDSIDIILRYNNPESLWDYMMSELRTTFLLPGESSTSAAQVFTGAAQIPVVQQTRLSTFLTVEYLAPTYKHVSGTSKKSIGKKSFGFNPAYLNIYLEDSLSWWHGRREAKGVKIEDAWKCRHCDFRDTCSWIHEKDAATLREVLEKQKMREIAGVKEQKVKKDGE